MKLLGTIVNGRVELDTPLNLPEGTRVVGSLEVDDWDEHIADLRRRLAEKNAGVPGMTVTEAFAALDAEMGWNISKAGKQ